MIAPGSLTSDPIRRRLYGWFYVLLLLGAIGSMLAYGSWRTIAMVEDLPPMVTPADWRSGDTVQVGVYTAVIALVVMLAPLHRDRRRYLAGAACVTFWLVAMDPRVWEVTWLVQAGDPLALLLGLILAVVCAPASFRLPLGWWLLSRSVGERGWRVGVAVYVLAGLLTGGALGWSLETAMRPLSEPNILHPGMLAYYAVVFHGLRWHDSLFEAIGLAWPHLPIRMF